MQAYNNGINTMTWNVVGFLLQAIFMVGDINTLTSFVIASKKVLPSNTLYVTTSMMSAGSRRYSY